MMPAWCPRLFRVRKKPAAFSQMAYLMHVIALHYDQIGKDDWIIFIENGIFFLQIRTFLLQNEHNLYH